MSDIKYNILYLDDEKENLRAFESFFFIDYNIFTADSAKKGLEVLSKESIHLILTDQRMPEMTGIEFLKKVLPLYPDVIMIIVTGYSDLSVVAEAINEIGIFQYITKPWNNNELSIIIKKALESYQLKLDKKRLLNELQQANEGLENKVKERTNELEQAKEKLLKSNQLKDKLFSVIAQDLRAPINDLSNYLQLLSNPSNSLSAEDIRNTALKGNASLQHVSNLLEKLLTWSMQEMRTTQYKFQNVRVKPVLDQIVEDFKERATEKSIQLTSKLDHHNLMMGADQQDLTTILKHLTDNAIKYTDKGGKVLLNAFKDLNAIKVEIIDTGVGMSADVIAKLFVTDKHIQTKGTWGETGSGLGLKVSQEAVKKLNGKINVQSAPNYGSKFTLEIPKANFDKIAV